MTFDLGFASKDPGLEKILEFVKVGDRKYRDIERVCNAIPNLSHYGKR